MQKIILPRNAQPEIAGLIAVHQPGPMARSGNGAKSARLRWLLASCSVIPLVVGASAQPALASCYIGPFGYTNSGSVSCIALINTTFSGSVVNNGTVSPGGISLVNSTINGGGILGAIRNHGTMAGAITIDSNSAVKSTGNGTSVNVDGVSTFSGGISNAGVIAGGQFGINVYSNIDFGGGIFNASTGTVSATPGTNHTAIVIDSTSTFTGGVTNAGTISGANIGINAGNYNGHTADMVTFGGGITNTGTISTVDTGILVAGVSTFSGNISNSGTITANVGVAIGAGQNFAGGAIVNSGSITGTGGTAIDMSGDTSAVVIQQVGGTLNGGIAFSTHGDTFTGYGVVNNGSYTLNTGNGTVYPTLTGTDMMIINGNYAQNATGTLEADIRGGSTSQLAITGTGTGSLNGTFTLLPGGVAPTAGSYNIVTSTASGISGDFALAQMNNTGNASDVYMSGHTVTGGDYTTTLSSFGNGVVNTESQLGGNGGPGVDGYSVSPSLITATSGLTFAQGGNGGDDGPGGNGGDGTSTNTVTGDGASSFAVANGGNGGAGTAGGAGGNGGMGTANSTAGGGAATGAVSANATSTGGNGGNNTDSSAAGGNGGNATSTATATNDDAANAATANATATGGLGGTGTSNGAGGTANATATANNVGAGAANANAAATAFANTATALANANGSSGTVTAQSQTYPSSTGAGTPSVQALASAPVSGSNAAQTVTSLGGAVEQLLTPYTSTASVPNSANAYVAANLAPTGGSLATTYATYSAANTAFSPPSSTVVGSAVLSVASGGSPTSQTYNSTVQFNDVATNVGGRNIVATILGSSAFSPASAGSVDFYFTESYTGGGLTKIDDQSFASLGAALAALQNENFNLGALPGSVSGAFDITANLYLTTMAANGIELNMLYGYSNLAAPSSVPEPSTWVVFSAGFLGFGYYRLRRRREALGST